MDIDPLSALRCWHFISRLGEAQIVMPVALAVALGMGWGQPARRFALRWMGCLGLAVFLTTTSKLAFIGWGFGFAEFNFTGVSGHTLIAAAVYPVMAGALSCGASTWARRGAIAASGLLVLLIGISRIAVHAHSISEVAAGWVMGAAVSLPLTFAVERVHLPLSPALSAFAAIWLLVMPFQASASNTHLMVTRLALALSGHQVPHTRAAMLREVRRHIEMNPGTAALRAPGIQPPRVKDSRLSNPGPLAGAHSVDIEQVQ